MNLSDLDLCDSDKEIFGDVLSKLRLDQLASFASRIRFAGHPSTGNVTPVPGTQWMECKVLPKVDCGSYNAVLSLSFIDGLVWVIKIPSRGHSEDWIEGFDTSSLESEAQTMRMIRRETSIPVPEVFAFDSSLDNELRCPFILMKKTRGRSMFHGWYDDDSSQAKVNKFRSRALRGIAEAMTQLNKFTFDKCGGLDFDLNGIMSGIGPRRNAQDYYDLVMTMGIDNEVDNGSLRSDIGVFKDAKSYFLKALDRREETSKDDEFIQGSRNLLRLFIDWGLVDGNNSHEKPFGLAHPDLDIQNVFTLEDGTITGFIDWDWIAAVPRSVGCHKFPKFLTVDFDPTSYEFDIKAGQSTCKPSQCSPGELSCYRAMYAQFVEQLAGREAATTTQKSLVVGSTELAATDPETTLAIVGHLFDQIEQLAGYPEAEHCFGTGSETSDESEMNEANTVDNMNFKELLEEIQKLTTHHVEEISPASQYMPREETLTDDINDLQERSHHGLRQHFARLLGTFGIRRGTKCAHPAKADPSATDLEAGASPVPIEAIGSRMNTSRTFFRWVRRKLRWVPNIKGCEFDLEAGLKDSTLAKPPGICKIKTTLMWLRKIISRTWRLLRLGKPKPMTVAIEQIPPPANVTISHEEDSEAIRDREKRAACRLVAGLLQDNSRGLISESFQTACARWLVKNLQPREDEHQNTDGEVKDTDQALKDQFHAKALKKFAKISNLATEATTCDRAPEYAEILVRGEQEVDGRSMAAVEPNLTNEAWSHCVREVAGEGDPDDTASDQSSEVMSLDRDDDVANDAATDDISQADIDIDTTSDMNYDSDNNEANLAPEQRYFKQPTSSTQTPSSDEMTSPLYTQTTPSSVNKLQASNHSPKTDQHTNKNEELPCSKYSAVNDNEDKIVGDRGGFTMWEVCHALAKNDLDEARMKRLRDGFFALLDQTV